MSTPLKVVALGGGHGLSASLCALRWLTPDLTAVVTVADDGGSSGRIRRELGGVPPGDLRMAVAALAGEGDWQRLLQHRFPGQGQLGGAHPQAGAHALSHAVEQRHGEGAPLHHRRRAGQIA